MSLAMPEENIKMYHF